MGADAVKYIAEIFKWINLTQLATGNQSVNDSGLFGTGVTSGKKLIFLSNSDDAEDTLGKIVVNIKVTIFCVSIQHLPLSTGITYCLADGTLGNIRDSHEWRDFKLYIGLFYNYWRFHAPINEMNIFPDSEITDC